MVSVLGENQIDVFQASLLNIVAEASDIGINNFFENKKNELQRFIICQYIESLHATNPLRSKTQQHNLSHNQNLRYNENDHIKESKLKNEWISLLNPSKQKTITPIFINDNDRVKERDDNNNKNDKEIEIISYKSIGKSCWIYIVQNYLTQNDKIKIMPHLNHFFNDLVSDNLCWKELSLTSYEINTNIPYYYNQFELFLSRSCTNLQSIDFECLAKNKISWQIIWKLISKYCLTLRNIHIGLYDGVWKFEFNQLAPICDELFINVKKHIYNNDNDNDQESDKPYLPISRIECAPGVMPSHIVSLLQCATNCQHFFVPLIYNDSDQRWNANDFWNIPHVLPSTLKSFRGFDAQTPLKFVHQCIQNLPNIQEFHVVLYFGSAHPDFIACGYSSDTLIHLAENCKLLQSFEGYFHSTQSLLDGVELMVQNCTVLKLIGLLFHPDVNDDDIDNLINNIRESTICSKYNPSFSRLTENPNQHVTLRVLEITFDHDHNHNHHHHNNNNNININIDDNDILINNNNNDIDNDIQIDGIDDISSDHLKSLDEIEISEDDDIMNNIGLDERPIYRNSNNSDNDSNLMSNNSDNDSNASKS